MASDVKKVFNTTTQLSRRLTNCNFLLVFKQKGRRTWSLLGDAHLFMHSFYFNNFCPYLLTPWLCRLKLALRPCAATTYESVSGVYTGGGGDDEFFFLDEEGNQRQCNVSPQLPIPRLECKLASTAAAATGEGKNGIKI